MSEHLTGRALLDNPAGSKGTAFTADERAKYRLEGLLPHAVAQFADFAAAVAVLLYEWYIARVALAVSASQAVPVVLLDLVLGSVLSRITEALY